MTTSPVMGITDELVAELERECRTGADDHAGMGHEEESALFDRIGDVLLALMAERAELLRDAERYRWLRDSCRMIGDYADDNEHNLAVSSADGEDVLWFAQLDSAIDSAMQSEAAK